MIFHDGRRTAASTSRSVNLFHSGSLHWCYFVRMPLCISLAGVIGIDDVDRLSRQPNSIVISCNLKVRFHELREVALASQEPGTPPIDEASLWEQSVGGWNKGRLFGFGTTQDPRYAMTGECSSSSSDATGDHSGLDQHRS